MVSILGAPGVVLTRIKGLYGRDGLLTKIASGATTGALGAFLANPVAPGTCDSLGPVLMGNPPHFMVKTMVFG